MNDDRAGRPDDLPPRRGRLARIAVTSGLTAAVVAAVVASGGLTYAAAGVGESSHRAAASDQYRPGWGCGDRNHEHTGPPGQQYASPPPGCTR